MARSTKGQPRDAVCIIKAIAPVGERVLFSCSAVVFPFILAGSRPINVAITKKR